MNSDDGKWMREAVTLAKKALGHTSPNPLVGAVIVKDGEKIGAGYHRKAGEAHAEIEALNSLSVSPEGATIYVTLEPCSTWGRTPPCTDAVLRSGIRRVVTGSVDPNPKHAGRAAKIFQDHGVEFEVGVEKEKCDALNEAFFTWITRKRPFVLLKLAETLDGKIATKNGESQWITGVPARKHVQKLRLWADAILAGAETFRTDHPRFTVRNENDEILKTPRRIIATHSPETLVLPDTTWEAVNLPSHDAWKKFLKRLGEESVTALLIEGGGELAASALRAGIVDKVEFHIAPKILGGKNSRSSVAGFDPERIDEAISLNHMKIKRLGDDFIVSAYPEIKEQR